MLSADILLKGLGGLAVVGGATTVGVCYRQEKWIFAKKKVETLTLEELAGKVGLDCKKTNTEPTATAGVECSKKTGEGANLKISVKKDSDPFELADLPNANSGKIKVYKTSEGEKYNNDLKFVIEEGDIGTESNKKLEEFETYEIKEEGDKYHLTKKTSVNDGIKKALGLPGDCDLPTTAEVKSCDLDDAKFKKINFDGGNEERGTVPKGAKLKISKVEDSVTDFGSYKFKFALETTADTKISSTTTIKKGTNTEFKIKATTTSGSPKTLTLEKAWTVKSLGDKAGLTCPENGDTASSKECTLKSSSVNINNGDTTKKFSGLSKKDTNEKKVKYDVGEADYSQGYRFYTDETNGIELKNGSVDGGTDSDKKIEPKGSAGSEVYYEILKDTDGKWYLTKKAKTQGT